MKTRTQTSYTYMHPVHVQCREEDNMIARTFPLSHCKESSCIIFQAHTQFKMLISQSYYGTTEQQTFLAVY